MILPFRVAVGSTNPVKVRAVESAMRQIFPDTIVQGIDVPSNVKDQPTSVEETKRGAINRAKAALEAGQADWAFGLEAGVYYDTDGICWLGGVAAVVDSEDHVSTSSEFPLALPHQVAQELREGGELGPIIDRITGLTDTKKGMGAIGFLTGGLITREESWRSKIIYAITPFLHEDMYGEVRNRLRNQNTDVTTGPDPYTSDSHSCNLDRDRASRSRTGLYKANTEHEGAAAFPFAGRTLDVFQDFHVWLDEQKNFDPDPILNTTLLSIEVGELSREITSAYLKVKRAMQQHGDRFHHVEGIEFQEAFHHALQDLQEPIGNELADCLAYVLKLANYSGIDLEDAYLKKMVQNIQRSWT